MFLPHMTTLRGTTGRTLAGERLPVVSHLSTILHDELTDLESGDYLITSSEKFHDE